MRGALDSSDRFIVKIEDASGIGEYDIARFREREAAALPAKERLADLLF
jgi:hypothetical protein